MKRITISEQDSTTLSAIANSNEVVYVPGFAWTGDNNTVTIASSWRQPHLCTSLSEFEKYFGTTPPKFMISQYYPVYTTTGTTSGFASSAIPTDTSSVDSSGNVKWFSAGDTDPAYNYARELLLQGLPVVYERLNSNPVFPINSAIFSTNWKGEYSTSVSYVLNNIVGYGGKYYIARTAASGKTPGTDSEWVVWRGALCYDDSTTEYSTATDVFKWNTETSKITFHSVITSHPVSYTGITSFGDYNSEKTYALGDIVTVSGTHYVSLADNNLGHSPASSSSSDYWGISTFATGSSSTDTPAWSSASVNYSENNVVKVTASSTTTYWRCTKAHTSSSEIAPSDGSAYWTKNINIPVYIDAETGDGQYYVNTDVVEQVTTRGYYTRSTARTDTFTDYSDDEAAIKFPESDYYDVSVSQFYTQLTSTDTVPTMPVNTCAVYRATNPELSGIINPLVDLSLFSIKYFTTGGWPNFEYVYRDSSSSTSTVHLPNLMANMAEVRGDAIALIDHTNYSNRALVSTGSVYEAISTTTGSFCVNSAFATMFTPWATYSSADSYNTSTLNMPASFGYLSTLAYNVKNYSAWLPVAGGIRGVIPNFISPIISSGILTNTIADNYQVGTDSEGISINAITYVNPYGYCIWGNRTLLKLQSGKPFATEFINLRNVMSDIKKESYKSAQKYMFSQNTNTIWVKFKDSIANLIEQMKSDGVIKAYSMSKRTTSDPTKLSVVIKVWPIYAVESVDILVNMTDESVETSES